METTFFGVVKVSAFKLFFGVLGYLLGVFLYCFSRYLKLSIVWIYFFTKIYTFVVIYKDYEG